ncbi:threonine dehydratase biosynthetic, chloroplastic-like [Dorcoceras hygrometricum]|uniref:Threonine dehydratase biosynthetic, chloroplastic-like n=1 Tax=Dorcoceras hygrometricum TaxID=472368 RepID=A0A2Z7CI41_9LAMI|nr:threonine dehydratase biosynthetic, chloroplastic-like [Dorcoceras hygrometricum]
MTSLTVLIISFMDSVEGLLKGSWLDLRWFMGVLGRARSGPNMGDSGRTVGYKSNTARCVFLSSVVRPISMARAPSYDHGWGQGSVAVTDGNIKSAGIRFKISSMDIDSSSDLELTVSARSLLKGSVSSESVIVATLFARLKSSVATGSISSSFSATAG